MSNINVMRKNLGPVTAYKYAVSKGYTGTEQEFAALMASYATVAQEAEAAKDDAVDAKTAAEAAQAAAEAAQAAAEAAASQAEGAIVVDDTLSVEGRAADAKVVGDAVGDVKSNLNDITGNEVIDSWNAGKYYNSSSIITNIDITALSNNANYACMCVSCTEGDVFYYTGKGSSSARNWAFLKSNGDIISRANAETYEDIKLIAPELSAYIVFNANLNNKKRVVSGEYIKNKVNVLETVVDNNTAKISNIDNTLDLFFESKTVSKAGELVDEFVTITEVEVGNSESIRVASAQMFEAKYPGTQLSYGVNVTKNDDGTYTFNGTATSSAWFHLNQSTRTGTDNRVELNGKYSFGYDIVSGSIKKETYEGNTCGLLSLIDLDNIPTRLVELSLGGRNETTYEANDEAVIVAFRATAGVTYNNLRIAPKLNKGETLYPYTQYKTTVTLTEFDTITNTIKNYTPYIWLTVTPSTENITVIGKNIKTDDGESGSSVDLYNVLVKYNNRIDMLAQLFTRPLFLVYTDIHNDNENLLRIKEWFDNNKKVYISDVFCLGDMVDDQATDTISFESDEFWKSTIKVIGNHDVLVGGTIPGITEQQAYEKYLAADIQSWNVVRPTGATYETYFYKDYSNAIRFIVIDTYFYTEEQHTWFVDTLDDAKNNNLAVIVCQHEDICTATEKQPLSADYPFAKKHDGFTGLQYRTYGNGGTHETKRNAVDTFIDNGGTFVCWLVGHQHADMTGYYQGTHGKQLSVLLSNASNSTISSMRIKKYSQDCFTYLGIDTNNHYLYLLRIGETVDKWFHQNLFMLYDYANHTVIEYH